ncbi:MAG: hypothetical protein VB934_14060, partial [Polyangiaceae bacterium]
MRRRISSGVCVGGRVGRPPPPAMGSGISFSLVGSSLAPTRHHDNPDKDFHWDYTRTLMHLLQASSKLIPVVTA